jgi:uracil-DNA glycosylase family protein
MAARALERLHEAAAECTDCGLYRNATQVVFGEGPVPARLMMIGEQPGDREDRAGHPFVGPAGALLDDVLVEAGIARDDVFVTNAVKHFKWQRGSGKVRIHKSPSRSEVVACSQWWQREVEVVKPEVVVCLGAVAAKAVLGPSTKVSEIRGKPIEQLGLTVVATLHPAAILRAGERREAMRADLVDDLHVAAALLAG